MARKIVIIGGGPGGYAAAIRAAQLGAQVTLTEAAKIGGTCLNIGCIPTKALLHAGEFYRKAITNAVPGVKAEGVSLDWPAAQRHKEEIVGRLTGGVGALLRYNGVTVMNGTASLLGNRKVKIGDETLEADAVILATGSVNVVLPIPGAVLPGVIDSTGALSLENVPASVFIVGGGVIGVEFATLFQSLGAAVTIIEMLPEILPTVDAEIAGLAREALTASGVQVFTSAKLLGIGNNAGQNSAKKRGTDKTVDRLTVAYEKDGGQQQVTAEKVLIAVGRRPNTACLGLEEAGVKQSRGAVETDEYFRTSIPDVYAVGDCNGKMMLAHAAMAQGIAAAEHIMGQTPHYNAKIIPSCVYSSPEIAGVGMTEKQAQDAGMDYVTGRFSLEGNAKALIEGDSGLIKIIADRKLGEVLGVHMLGPRVTDMIAEATLCMSMEGTVEELISTIHAHPTVSESVSEAAMSVFGKPIHGV